MAGEEPLSLALAPVACTLRTCREPFLWRDRSLIRLVHLAVLASLAIPTRAILHVPVVRFELGTIYEVSFVGAENRTPVTHDDKKLGEPGQ